MELIIDRFEGEYAIVELEAGVFESIPKTILPSKAQEGDILKITIDSEGTKKRLANINNLMDNLFED